MGAVAVKTRLPGLLGTVGLGLAFFGVITEGLPAIHMSEAASEWLILSVLAAVAVVFGRGSRSRLADLAIAGLACGYLWGYIVSIDQRLSLTALMPVWVFVVLYLIGRSCERLGTRVLPALAGAALVYALWIIGDFLSVAVVRSREIVLLSGHSEVGWVLVSRAKGLAHHPNNAAMVLVPLVVVVLDAGWSSRGARRLAYMAVGLAGVLAIAMTGSRGGILGLAAGIGFVAIARGGSRLLRRPAVLLGLGLVAAVSVLLLVIAPSFVSRGLGRQEIWQASVELIRARPLGWGPGGLALVLPSGYAEPSLVVPVVTAHSTYLQALAEIGIPGTLMVLSGVGLSVWLVLRRGIRSTNWAGVAPCAAFLALSVHGLFEAGQQSAIVPASAGLVALVFTTSQVRPRQDGPSARRSYLGPRVALAALVVIGGAGLARVSEGNAAAMQAALAGSSQHWSDASGRAEIAAEQDPMHPGYSLLVGTAYGRAGNLDQAKDWLRRAVGQQPRVWLTRLVLAQAGRGADAKALDEARRLGATGFIEGALLELEMDPDRAFDPEMVAVLAGNTWVLPTGFLEAAGLNSRQREVLLGLVAEQGASCRILIDFGFSGSAPPGLSVDALETRCRKLAGKEHQAVIQAGRFYAAALRGDTALAAEIGARIPGPSDSALTRRVRGEAAMLAGNIDKAKRELAAASVLGDLPAVVDLWTVEPAEERDTLEALGWRAIQNYRIYSDGSMTVPARLVDWTSRVLASPVYRQGPFLAGSWEQAIPIANERFLSLPGVSH